MRTRKPPTNPGAPLTTTTTPIRASAADPPMRILRCAAHEFGLTGLLLFLIVTAVRWLLAPDSPLAIANPDLALAVLGALMGGVLTLLILSPSGRYSGGHLNPAVTVALWRLKALPGRNVIPYITAQAAGSLAGTALAGLAWGTTARNAPIAYAAVGPAPAWNAAAVFTAEAGAIVAVTLMLGAFLGRSSTRRLLPYAVGLATALIIALLGPRSGGSANPARQLGPALLSGNTTHLWIYLLAPVIGTLAGADIWRTAAALARRGRTHQVLPSDPDAPTT